MIRQALLSDLEDIAKVHIDCFPESFSSSLGVNLLKKFYFEYMKISPELFIVCEIDYKIVGFCMGYYMEQEGFMRRFIKNNIISFGIMVIYRLITGDKRAWRKVCSINNGGVKWFIVNEKFNYDNISKDKQADLLSICILEMYRGKGYADEMIREYLDILRAASRDVCLLSVDTNNARGLHFYEKNNFIVYRESDSNVRTYGKFL